MERFNMLRAKQKRAEREMQFALFKFIWSRRPHKSEISGKYLGFEPLSVFFHHILSKERYPEARYDENNIILVTFDEHQKVESDCEFFEEINKRREKLHERYNKK